MSKYERIKSLCKARKTSVAQMERDLGFARGSIAKIDEHKPSIEKVSKICEYLNISPMTLLLDSQSTLNDYKEANGYVESINNGILYGSTEKNPRIYEASAGSGRINDYDDMDNEEYSTVRIVGDSMYPSLHDGDLVRVHHVTETSPSDFAIIKINGDECCCKHIETTDTGIWVRSENESYEDVFYSVKDVLTLPVTIIGVAEEIISRRL